MCRGVRRVFDDKRMTGGGGARADERADNGEAKVPGAAPVEHVWLDSQRRPQPPFVLRQVEAATARVDQRSGGAHGRRLNSF